MASHQTGRHAFSRRTNPLRAAMMVTLKRALTEALRQLQEQSIETLLEAREDKILAYGRYKELASG